MPDMFKHPATIAVQQPLLCCELIATNPYPVVGDKSELYVLKCGNGRRRVYVEVCPGMEGLGSGDNRVCAHVSAGFETFCFKCYLSSGNRHVLVSEAGRR
jgi:hypothetical protein